MSPCYNRAMPAHLKAVFFDLDGTLRHNEPEGFDAFIGFLNELGHTLTLEQRYRAERWNHYYWSVAPELKDDIAEFGADTPAFWTRHAERVIEALGVNGGDDLPAQIRRCMAERYKPVNVVPEDVRPSLERLRAQNYTVALVSNRTEELDSLADALGMDGLFHFTLSAGQAQSWKPDPGIFLKALELAQCAPSEAAYVGDNYYADIEGARGAGLHPILLDPRGLFPEPGCPIIQAIGDIERALIRLGTSRP